MRMQRVQAGVSPASPRFYIGLHGGRGVRSTKETVMVRMISSTMLLSMLLCAAGCSPTADTPFVSEATAAPAKPVADYGWRTSISPTASDGAVADYD